MDKNNLSIVSVAAVIIRTLVRILIETFLGRAVLLIIVGIIVGIESAQTGHGFLQGFEDGTSEFAVNALIIMFALAALHVLIRNIINKKSKQKYFQKS